MPRLDCISILEAGSFGSDSGTVVVPSGEVPFLISAFSVGTASGVGTATAVGYTILQGDGVGVASGLGAAAGVGEGGSGADTRDAMVSGLFANLTEVRQAMTPSGMLDGA